MTTNIPTISLRKYAAGERDARGRTCDVVTVRITIANPGSLSETLAGLGYKPEANSNGKTGRLEYYARSADDLDQARDPLRGLVA